MIIPDITEHDIDKFEEELGGELKFDQVRRRALIGYDDIQACPGSGKTTLVAAKLILLAKKWNNKYQGILVLSHTNVAKEEIIQRLSGHEDGSKLLRYPHFIGTIQEFVNKFLGIPYCRSNGIKITQIDDELCVEKIGRNLNYKTKLYLKNKRASLYDLKHFYDNGDFNLKVPGFSKVSSSNSYRELLQAKENIRSDGYHFYSEMYEYGKALIHQYNIVRDFLRKRFVVAFVDEMQDTQEFQDNLINEIFNHEGVRLQRFGDPDQAIFDGMDGKSNTSYNGAELEVIQTSHRFNQNIAKKISGLSLKRLVGINSTLPDSNPTYPNTIFVCKPETRTKVLANFANLCLEHLPEKSRRVVKAIGAVGCSETAIPTLTHYFPCFDKTKSVNSFRAEKLIQLVRKCSVDNSMQNYKLLIGGVLTLLRLADKKILDNAGREVFYNGYLLKRELICQNKLMQFNKIIHSWLEGPTPSQDSWNEQIQVVIEILGIESIGPVLKRFIDYDEISKANGKAQSELNKYLHQSENGDLEIEVSTIHGVKGETHDATLVLETRFHEFDLDSIFDYLVNDRLPAPVKVRKREFMKRLFVAASRPRHLLCLAIDESRMGQERIDAAVAKGWQVVTVE